jgi:hypothetical protein
MSGHKDIRDLTDEHIVLMLGGKRGVPPIGW